MSANLERVLRGQRIVQAALPPFIERQMRAVYNEQWWQVVRNTVTNRPLPDNGSASVLANEMDLSTLVYLMNNHWQPCYRDFLQAKARTYLNEIKDIRNDTAHVKGDDLTLDDAYRALDTMVRFLEPFDKTRAADVDKIRGEVRAEQFTQQAPQPQAVTATLPIAQPAQPTPVAVPSRQTTVNGERAWRFVVEPHEDVRSGSFQTAQFAADLADVLAGQAEDDYLDPDRFFARTFITGGMRNLLASGVKRISGRGGDPVIQLKTAFGGGKTHTMIALYHLMRAGERASDLPGAETVLREAGVEGDAVPSAQIAVLVGTDLDPNEPRLDAAGRGVRVRTLWGELAAQIGGKEAYELVRQADENGVPPGADRFLALLEQFGPAVILIDEFVVYARKLYANSGLPSGSFESNLSFVQELTQAVRRSGNSLLVISIPEADVQLGGEAGKAVQQHLEHVIGRMDTIWRPVDAEEGFEVVRRRLFGDVIDIAARDAVCQEFAKLYKKNSTDFPTDAQTSEYAERLKRSYPFHPELFDRLYDDWSALPEFQRTRGVLKLMAAVVYVLWERGDKELLIMPGDLPLDHGAVRSELARYLPETFNAVIDHDVLKLPTELDQQSNRFGRIAAAKRLARAMLLGSAPVSQERARGVDDARLRLGVVRAPGDISVSNEALGKMANDFTYIFNESNRYWYDTRPNLNREAANRASAVSKSDVRAEIVKRLTGERGRGVFGGVHVFPESGDVPDGDEARLVIILPPEHPHRNTDAETGALIAAKAILDSRGNSPRLAKNMILFLAPDETASETMERAVRQHLAWASILEDKELLNIDQAGLKQAARQQEQTNDLVARSIADTYVWQLIPKQDATSFEWKWAAQRLPAGAGTLAERVGKQLTSNEDLIPKWSPRPVRSLLEQWFWKDRVEAVEIQRVWEALANYCYLPRLTGKSVLANAISDGMPFPDFFGYASGQAADGRYEGLVFNHPLPADRIVIGQGVLLVRADAAKAQQEVGTVTPPVEPPIPPKPGGGEPPIQPPVVPPVVEPSLPMRYFGSKQLDSGRLVRDVGEIADELIRHLSALPSASVRVTLEIEAIAPQGVPRDIQSVILENQRPLKVDGEFSDE